MIRKPATLEVRPLTWDEIEHFRTVIYPLKHSKIHERASARKEKRAAQSLSKKAAK